MKTVCAWAWTAAVIGLGLSIGPVVKAQDRPIQIEATEMPPYPDAVLEDGYDRGDVLVAVEVGANGSLLDALVTATNHPYFGQAALAAIRHWTFKPALHNGVPVTSVRMIRVHFEERGPVVVTQTGLENFREVAIDPGHTQEFYHSYTVNEVNRLPRPLAVSAPAYPAAARASGLHGVVRIDFFIDEHGRVRVPVVTSSPSPELSQAVLAAARNWRFTPAEVRGRPVLLQVAQSITFGSAVQGSS